MKAYEARTEIRADADEVWNALVEGSYEKWDSGVISLEGRVAPGEKIKVTSEANPNRAFAVRVSEFDPPRRMTWVGGMPLGLFKGTRTFTLSPRGDSTTFLLREEYTGLMLPLIWRSMPDLQPSFEKFVAGLKAKIEGSV